MRRIIFHFVFAWILILFIPIVCILAEGLWGSAPEKSERQTPQNTSIDANTTVSVMMSDSGEVLKIPLDLYLKGVVTAEMPASFELEALKAQTVAARSYTYNKHLTNTASPGIFPTHGGADVCTDYAHCKAYMTLEDATEKWGQEWARDYYPRIESAIEQTDGEVLMYHSQPVNAVFHSASYGRTENAIDVWGGDVAYLTSVESPLGVNEESQKSRVTVPFGDFWGTVRSAFPDADTSGAPSSWIKDVVRSEGGSVMTLNVGGVTIKGAKMRTLFGLKSANFSVSFTDTDVVFDVLGSGHGVGLSQYGANALAKDGYDYKYILSWYYSGTDISYWGKK